MKLDIYSDEIYIEDKYIGIGCLFVPQNKRVRLYKKLKNLRCLNTKSSKWIWNFGECDNTCKKERHINNNCEIHHQKISKSASYSRKEISKRWIKLLINNNRTNREMIYFKILYIDLDKLDKSFFGEENVRNNIYNRFYRTTIKGALSYFFENKIEIENIYHDKADDKEQHDYFPWHIAHSFHNEINRLKIMNKEIVFLDSDHKKYLNENDKIMDSHFIQYIDLILGTVSQSLFKLSKDSEKIDLSTIIYPLVGRIIKSPYNYNSSYHYYKKQDISVFPKSEIKFSDDLYGKLSDYKGEFHTNIPIKKPKNTNYSLDNWYKK